MKSENEKCRWLISGGSGFLGINLIRHLLQMEQNVNSLDLIPFDYEDCKDQVVAFVGDIRDPLAVMEAMEGVDYVVHCAAALPLYSKKEIFSTDIDGTRNIMDAALKAQVRRVIHISSTAVYGIPDHHPLKEDDELIGVGPYGKAKIEAEVVCEEYRKLGLRVSIIRPKSFIGPERLGVFALFYDWAHSGKNFPMIGRGKNRYQFLAVQDLCNAIVLCTAINPDDADDIFNIGAKDFTTMREDYQAVLDRAGYGKRIIGFPATPMIWTLRFLSLLRLSPLYKWVYETAAKDSFVSIEKAERVLGFNPQYSNKESLIDNYEWYIENIDRFSKNSGVTHRVPWKQGILRLVKVFF